MSPRPPFDPVRFACWLVAGVLAVECLVALAGMVACLWHSEAIITSPQIACDPKDRLGAILTGALAAALALLAGFKGPPKE
jgi:hypothetical protein